MPRKKKVKPRKLSTSIAADRLLRAAGRFIEAHGGAAVVAGGIQIHQEPGETFNFRLSIKITGRVPPSPSEDR